MAKWFKIFPLILFLPQLLVAQSNVRFNNLSVEHGLSQNTVICIFEDSRGFMWFGTQNGLNRYDGKNFKVYKHVVGDSTSLSSNLLQDILEDENGDLWIATWGGGLNKLVLNKNQFETLGMPVDWQAAYTCIEFRKLSISKLRRWFLSNKYKIESWLKY